MAVHVSPNHVISCYVFQHVHPDPGLGVIDLGDGLSVHPEFPFGTLPDHWTGWVGQRVEAQLDECNFAILCIADSGQKEELLAQRLWPDELSGAFFTALFLQGKLNYRLPTRHVQGQREGDASLFLHSISTAPSYYGVKGAPWMRIDHQIVQKAAELARGLCVMYAPKGVYRRVRKGFHAFRRALEERNADDKLHQLVRSIEAFVKASGREKFAKRLARIVEGDIDVFRQMYRLRNEVEHLGDYFQDLGDLSERQKDWLGRLRTYQAEKIACLLFNTIVTDPRKLSCFRDEAAISKFWAGKADWQPEHLASLDDLSNEFTTRPA